MRDFISIPVPTLFKCWSKPLTCKHISFFVCITGDRQPESLSALLPTLEAVVFSQLCLLWHDKCVFRSISHSKYFPHVRHPQFSCLVASFWWNETDKFLPLIWVCWVLRCLRMEISMVALDRDHSLIFQEDVFYQREREMATFLYKHNFKIDNNSLYCKF